ncbi:hypothetical protein D3C76_463190 [compost metagenome]
MDNAYPLSHFDSRLPLKLLFQQNRPAAVSRELPLLAFAVRQESEYPHTVRSEN